MAKLTKNPGPAAFQIPNLNLPTPLPVPSDLIPTSVLGKGTRGNASGKFVPLDLSALEKLTVGYDKLGYDKSDTDFAKRFPDLVKARDTAIDSAGAGIRGESDPLVTGTLESAGLGDVNFGSGNADQARNLGISILDKENRDRSYFQRLLQDNPKRAFGLNTSDILNAYNVQQKVRNDLSSAKFQSQLNSSLSTAQQNAQTQAALYGGIGKLAGTAVNSFLQPTGYGNNFFGGSTGYANLDLPKSDPDYGNSNYIGLGDSNTSGSGGI